ncbi:PAS domain-containing sensor histidine kinase [Ideonella sp.]|uniref:PAS domain-containing sensor histidine kinase n=1 Tax=Ideonella sp. TaxID=1929293 RepID=UPI0035B203C1
MLDAGLLEALAEESPDAIVVVDDGGHITFWNRTAEMIFGHPRHAVMGHGLHGLLFGGEHGRALGTDPTEASSEGGRWVDTVARCADGALLYVNMASQALRGGPGRPRGTVVTLADVTHLRTRRDARLLGARYRELFDSMPDAILVVNEIGRVALFNRQAEVMFGYASADVVGAPLEMLMPPRFRAGHGRHREHYMAHPHTRPMGQGLELYGQRQNGEEFPVEISLSPLRTDVGFFGLSAIRDISERRRVERALEEKNMELERASRAKDRFLATMSHELRTPLNAIIGFTGILLMRLPGPLTPDQEKQLGLVQSSGKHLLSLINDLLDLAKIDSGSVDMRLVPVDARLLVEEVGTTLRPAATTRGLALELRLPPEPLWVCADRRALQQILINLTNNAIKFTEQGGVTVSVELAPDDPARVVFGVSDTGVGMTPDEVGQLFHAFTQVGHPSRRPSIEGTGLGLYLCKKLAELHGSRIEVRSVPGQGSRFWMSLERAAGPAEAGGECA